MEISPLIVTLKTTCTATVITFFYGIFPAYGVSKLQRGKELADAILTLPVVVAQVENSQTTP